MACYVTAAPAFVRSKLCAPGGEQFLWFFEEWPLVIFTAFFLHFDSSKPFVFSDVLDKEY